MGWFDCDGSFRAFTDLTGFGLTGGGLKLAGLNQSHGFGVFTFPVGFRGCKLLPLVVNQAFNGHFAVFDGFARVLELDSACQFHLPLSGWFTSFQSELDLDPFHLESWVALSWRTSENVQVSGVWLLNLWEQRPRAG